MVDEAALSAAQDKCRIAGEHTYAKTPNQPFPRRCHICGEVERTISASATPVKAVEPSPSQGPTVIAPQASLASIPGISPVLTDPAPKFKTK